MAVEYDISSDVAVIKETGSVSQCARVTQMYSGQITYDDEAGSKFATATINGKSQRVMLCIAVNGTVNYDDVPSLYSTVDGHRCLNIVTPTETGTPDDVPSLYETVVIDGQNVRAVRCIMINKTPVYDGVSSTCTFTGDDGKTHTAQLVNKITGGSVVVIIKGTSPLNLPDAIANSLSYVKAFGGTHQGNIPNIYTQVNYVTNTAQTAVDTGIMIDFAKNYEFEVECRATTGSWYILQSRASSSGNVTGISGATSGNTITLVVGNVTVCTSAITRTVGNKLYVKATLNNGTATLYVKDETANTEDTKTGSYGTSQPNPTASVYLLGNAGGQYVDVNSDIYMARIKENDTVVMDYVPCRQVATAGFYDTVSGTFKTAETPANLSADGNTIPTPDAPMDIVSNNGVLKFNRVFKSFNGNIGSTGVVGAATSFLLHVAKVEPGKTYKVNNVSLYGFFTTEPEIGSVTYDESRTVSSVTTITVPNDNNIKYIAFRNATDGVLYSDDEPIYTDGTVETIKVCGKNLFDSSSDENEWVTTSGRIEYPATTKSNRISAHSGSVFTVSTSNAASSSNIILIVFWSAGGEILLRQAYTSSTTHTVTAPAGTAQLLVSCRIWANAGNVQVEKGSPATEYEPYYDGGTATAEMLLKVDDYQDEQEILSGVVTRKVGVLVLDGTENWSYLTSSGYERFSYVLPNLSVNANIKKILLCNYYESFSASSVYSSRPTYSCWIEDGKNLRFHNNNYTTAASWKAYLAAQFAAGTPVIVLYPLAEPTTESVTGQALQVTDGDNTLEITQASLTGLELEAEYQAAVQLTIQEVQDANLDNNVEVTIS